VRQSNVSEAVFGQASYKLTDAFSLTGGVRWTSDVKGMTAAGPLDSITTPVKVSGSNLSWDVSADYIVNDTVNLYARIATGFRAPSIQGRTSPSTRRRAIIRRHAPRRSPPTKPASRRSCSTSGSA